MAATETRLATPPQPSPVRRLGRPLLVHLPFALLLVAGVVLRLMAWGAYRPALLFPDSRTYLLSAANGTLSASRPGGCRLQPADHPAPAGRLRPARRR